MFGKMLTTSVPMSVFWMILTSQINLEGFLIGMVFSMLISGLLIVSLQTEAIPVHVNRAPKQVVFALIYGVRLAIDIVYSGFDVTLKVLNFRPLRPGIIEVPIQLKDEDDYKSILSGLSAHGITITPGQLVVDFDGTDTMYVHCLDVEASAQTLDADQTRRLELLKKVIGND